ncbi:MAG: hypothetical protein LBL75_03025 [Rickettsiales bacterium]|jgi:FMN phosphatase YigB (HAD superfamily)|nr:hypothetical protein [Rickettsiales bacterium]
MIKAIIFDYVGVLGGGVIGDFFNLYPEHKNEILRLFIEQFDLGTEHLESRYIMLANAVGVDSEIIKQQLQKIGNNLFINKDLMSKILFLRKDYKIGLLTNSGLGPIVENIDYQCKD